MRGFSDGQDQEWHNGTLNTRLIELLLLPCLSPFRTPSSWAHRLTPSSLLRDAHFSSLQNAELCASTTYSSGLRGYTSYSPHLRRSLPNMHHMSSEPPKIYPAHLLFVSNYRLPNDVDRCHLEVGSFVTFIPLGIFFSSRFLVSLGFMSFVWLMTFMICNPKY